MRRFHLTIRRILLTVLLHVALFVGCGSGNSEEDADAGEIFDDAVEAGDESGADLEQDPDEDADAGGDPAVDPDEEEFTPVCNEGSSWSPGQSAFRDVTAEWGLLGVVGVYLNTADIDGDGWPDLLVRNGGGPDDFSAGGERSRWVLRNTGAGEFEDVTQSSGLLAGRVNDDPDFGRNAKLFASGDVNNDGYLDVFTGCSRIDYLDESTETAEIMLGNGDGTFTLGPEGSAARFADKSSNPVGASFVDFDLDGNLDLWVVHNERPVRDPMQDKLLRGDGEGGFTDVTYPRGLYTREWNWLDDLNSALCHSWGWGALACDLNNDGMAELLASSYGRSPNHLWRAARDGEDISYVNESVASGYAFDLRVDWTDDLNAQCYCEDNPEEEDCDMPPEPESYAICEILRAAFGDTYRWSHELSREPFQLGGNSGTTVCFDINNDGFFDLLTTEIVHSDVGSCSDPSEILVNLGDPDVRFDRPGNDVTGLLRVDDLEFWNHGDMTAAVFDFDNDGWPDIYIGSAEYSGTKGLLFHQEAPLEFELLDTADYFEHYRSHGVTAADFDRDGDLDIVVGHSLFRCEGYPDPWECSDTSQIRFFENLMGEGSNWLQLRLEGGGGANRFAIGARVEVAANGYTQMQQVDGGHGRNGLQPDLLLHFGLGPACEAEVTVHWPDASGSVQTFTVPANARHYIVQGSDPVIDPK